MRRISFLLAIIILGACTTLQSIPTEIQAEVEKISDEDLPVYASLEQQHCPKSRYPSFEKRRTCKYDVRREIVARQIMREHEKEL